MGGDLLEAALPPQATEEFESEEHYSRVHAETECVDLSGGWTRKGDGIAIALRQANHGSGRVVPFGDAKGRGVAWKYRVLGSMVTLDGPDVKGVIGEVLGDKGSRTIAFSDGTALTEAPPESTPQSSPESTPQSSPSLQPIEQPIEPPSPPPSPPIDLSGKWWCTDELQPVVVTLSQVGRAGSVEAEGPAVWKYTKYTVSETTITFAGPGVRAAFGEISGVKPQRSILLPGGKGLKEGEPPRPDPVVPAPVVPAPRPPCYLGCVARIRGCFSRRPPQERS